MYWITKAISIIFTIAIGIGVIIAFDNFVQSGIEIPENVKSLVEMIPFCVLFLVLIIVIRTILNNNSLVDEEEQAYYLDQDDIAVEPGTLKVRDAKKILKIRYAKGEINSLEYSERMSRL